MTEYINKQKLIKAIEEKRPLNWNDTEAELAEQGAFDYIMELIKGFCDDETDRINELMEADKEGRCLVLPCKEGTPVYNISYPLSEEDPREIYESVFLVTNYYDIGNTVFFTKEEAEKALEGLELTLMRLRKKE